MVIALVTPVPLATRPTTIIVGTSCILAKVMFLSVTFMVVTALVANLSVVTPASFILTFAVAVPSDNSKVVPSTSTPIVTAPVLSFTVIPPPAIILVTSPLVSSMSIQFVPLCQRIFFVAVLK